MLSSAVPLAAFALLVTAIAAPVPKLDTPPSKAKVLLDQMRAGTYRGDGFSFPKLAWDDIPGLLDHAGSSEKLKVFPTNPISSLSMPACTEGVMALWLVEGVRKGGKYPSLNPLLVPVEEGKLQNSPDEVAARAYKTWWFKVKTLPPEKAREVNPLEGTGLRWR
jgi:hypothetical protein